jgi:2'-5' RNA ligase
MRCFVGFELPPKTAKLVSNIQKDINLQNLLTGKFVEEQNLHLTLKFLGELKESQVKQVSAALHRIKHPTMKCSLANLGVFDEKYVRVVWIGIKSEGIFSLHKDIDFELAHYFPADSKFHSHVTLVRPKKVEKAKLLDYLAKYKVLQETFDITEFKLKSSQLTPLGPIYTTLDTFNLS